MAGQDQFEAYFRRADLDGDGKISGAEAVSFFQGSNLPKHVLAQIWTYADQSRSGFLGQAEFYNALKLVTVAQSKRDLTPEIVNAALYGPAAAKIPPPQINLSALPANRVNPTPASAPTTQMGMAAPTASQSLGFRGPAVPNPGMPQQYFPSQQTQSMRPPQAIPLGTASRPTQSFASMVGQSQAIPTGPQTTVGMLGQSQAMPAAAASHPPQVLPGGPPSIGIANSKIPNDWLGGQATGGLTGPRGVTPSTAATSSEPQARALVSSQPTVTDSKTPVVLGNGLGGNSFSGGDLFSATASTAKGELSGLSYSATATSTPTPSTVVPASSGMQSSQKSNSLDSLQNAFAMQPLGNQPSRSQSLPNLGQQVPAPSSSALATSSISVGTPNPSDSNQIPWPKMKPSDIQKYTKVFMEVDIDRDGRITGEQARNLFLSWRLPREVLKQVWDLSDQDSDSMLSLREFCFALYLMERYREGRPLPSALPSNVMYDETLLSMTGQPRVTHGNATWGPIPGFGQQPAVAVRSMAPTTDLRPPVPVSQSQHDSSTPSNQQKSGGSLLEDSFLNGPNAGDHNLDNSMTPDPAAEKKVAETEKVILDSKEKIEYYRTKMQELVLYKSRCDNKLNEITERALADKREAEMLGKKYEEKYKQVAEVASKLTIEEAMFRDIQERKMELSQAIVNVERGGSADGLLQVRADRIQSDLDELVRALTERSKKHGLDVKSAKMIELPTGWQPGIQDGAATWDEDWDKFEDEGFSNDLTVDVKNVSTSSMTHSHTVQNGKAHAEGSSTPDSLSNGNGKSGHYLNNNEPEHESESADTHSEDELVRSPQGSPAGRTSLESPSEDFSDVFAKSTEADAEAHRNFDDSTWGAFDTNDDVDSIWGFNPSSSKDIDSEKQRDIFGSDDFGLKPIITESPSVVGAFQKKSLFFEDSVPGTPASRFGNSPRYSEAGDHFDNYSRFDSFSMHEGGFSPKQEKLTRFDSINSTKDFAQSHAFSSFDDSDPFGSSGPFRVSSDNQTSKKGPENWGSF